MSGWLRSRLPRATPLPLPTVAACLDGAMWKGSAWQTLAPLLKTIMKMQQCSSCVLFVFYSRRACRAADHATLSVREKFAPSPSHYPASSGSWLIWLWRSGFSVFLAPLVSLDLALDLEPWAHRLDSPGLEP